MRWQCTWSRKRRRGSEASVCWRQYRTFSAGQMRHTSLLPILLRWFLILQCQIPLLEPRRYNRDQIRHWEDLNGIGRRLIPSKLFPHRRSTKPRTESWSVRSVEKLGFLDYLLGGDRLRRGFRGSIPVQRCRYTILLKIRTVASTILERELLVGSVKLLGFLLEILIWIFNLVILYIILGSCELCKYLDISIYFRWGVVVYSICYNPRLYASLSLLLLILTPCHVIRHVTGLPSSRFHPYRCDTDLVSLLVLQYGFIVWIWSY